MKRFTGYALALATGIAMSVPAMAQETITRQGNETAMEMATRTGTCGDRGVAGAEFVRANNITQLHVRCMKATGATGDGIAGMSGGLGAGAVAAGVVVVAGVVAAASGGGSTTSTTGTN